MSKIEQLIQVTEEEKNAILDHFHIDEKEFEDNVQRLKEWVHQCEHLPHDMCDNKFKVCLLNSKMSLERAKQMVEAYYRMRTIYFHNFFDKLMPNTEEYMLAKRFVKTTVMPKLTPNLCRVTIHKLSDPDGEANHAVLYEILVLMIAELRLLNDFFISNIVIIDFEDYTWKNLVKFTPAFNQMLVNILNALNLRIQAIHLINLPNFIDHIMRLLKFFLPVKIVQKIHLHKTYETLWEHIPREYLPSNYEGTQRSVEDLYEEWCEQIEQSEDIFKVLLDAKSTEKFDSDQYQQDLFGMGVEGSFRKLAVD